MKISITFDFTDEQRKIIARKDGVKGKASRDEMKRWAHSIVFAALTDYEADDTLDR